MTAVVSPPPTIDTHPAAAPASFEVRDPASIRDGIINEFARQYRPRLNTTPNGATLMIATGLVVLSDWVASNKGWFPPDVTTSSSERVQDGFDAAQLPPRWEPGQLWPWGHGTRPAQQSLIDLAVDEPSLYLLEAPTGEGKTKAALALAGELVKRQNLSGLTFALPTRASADSILPDLTEWAGQQPAGMFSLEHGNAPQNQAWRGAEPSFGEALLDRHQLSPMKSLTVVTVDQLIAATLNVKHQMLRHLALAGRVVIIDEVHAYDAHMNNLLDNTLRWLAAYRVPVILLSATLPPTRRAQLLRAYTATNTGTLPDAYPLAVRAGAGTWEAAGCEPSGRAAALTIRHTTPDGLLDAIPPDGNVAVIRNTVDRAVSTYLEAKDRFGAANVTLLHSRFLSRDRARLEQQLRAAFGPGPSGGRNPNRPTRHIVVATQVIEQSLDVDFDHLVTDLAPADLVLQRAGKVARHSTAARPAGWVPSVTVVGVDVTDSGQCLPYDMWTMAQSADQWTGRAELNLPADIPVVVKDAYEVDRHPDLRGRYEQSRAGSELKAALKQIPMLPDGVRMDLPRRPDDTGLEATVREGEASLEATLNGDSTPVPKEFYGYLIRDEGSGALHLPASMYNLEIGVHPPWTG